jgi:hypothetical protein
MLLLVGTTFLGVVLAVVVLLCRRDARSKCMDGRQDTWCGGWNTPVCHRGSNQGHRGRPRLGGKLDLLKIQIIIDDSKGRE